MSKSANIKISSFLVSYKDRIKNTYLSFKANFLRLNFPRFILKKFLSRLSQNTKNFVSPRLVPGFWYYQSVAKSSLAKILYFFNKKLFHSKMLLLLGTCFLYSVFFCAWLHAAVVINEFVYDAAGSDSGNEWIELYNSGPNSVNLQGWSIQVDDNEFPGITKANLCGILPAGAFYLIKETSSTISSTVTADFVSGTLGLGNAGSKADGIQLLDSLGTVVDRVVYGFPDTDNLCGGNCISANAVASGSSLSRSVPGSNVFVELTSGNVSAQHSGGLCPGGSCPQGSGNIYGVITEVSPSVSGGDFVEIFVTQSSNWCGAKLFEAQTLIKTFPSVQPLAQSFVLLHASASGADETKSSGDTNANGIIDLYSDESSPGISGSVHNNLTLKNSDDTIVDFVSWFVGTSGSFSQSKSDAYDEAAAAARWSPLCASGDFSCYLNGSIAWNNRALESMSRRMASNGLPKNSFPAYWQDWQLGLQSPGRGYSAQISPNNSRLTVFQSPFSPYGDGRYSESILMYKGLAGSVVNLFIFNSQGRKVRTVLESVLLRSDDAQTVIWDGRDQDGNIVPLGIYIVRVEISQPGSGTEVASKTVVVGRRL